VKAVAFKEQEASLVVKQRNISLAMFAMLLAHKWLEMVFTCIRKLKCFNLTAIHLNFWGGVI